MEKVDVVVIGGGVSGLSAALYMAKAGLNTVVLDKDMSQLQSVDHVWNIPGIADGIPGVEWLQQAQQQVRKYGGRIIHNAVISFSLHDRPFTVMTAEGGEWIARYLVIAINLGFELLAEMGIDMEINEYVPSRKIRKVIGTGFDGQSNIPGLYFSGLLANIPSQTVIAAGQGAFVGVQIASDFLGRSFMWHD